MRHLLHGLLLAGLLGAPALAQDKPQDQTQPQAPASGQPAGSPQDAGEAAKGAPIAGTPDLAVASVKAQSGHRVSKIIGAAVMNGSNQQIGTIDDVIMNDQDKAVLAIIAVGGFLGVGSKLVAEPYSALKFEGAKVELPDASKDSLNGMPSFTYGQ